MLVLCLQGACLFAGAYFVLAKSLFVLAGVFLCLLGSCFVLDGVLFCTC